MHCLEVVAQQRPDAAYPPTLIVSSGRPKRHPNALVAVMTLLVLLAALTQGHVRLNYIDGSDNAIRNANSATGNGRGSVGGACGGQDIWGANGNSVGKDGQEFTLNIQYAAGHNGAFAMAYSCAGTSQNDLAVRRIHGREAAGIPTQSAAAAGRGESGGASGRVGSHGDYVVATPIPPSRRIWCSCRMHRVTACPIRRQPQNEYCHSPYVSPHCRRARPS